MARVDAVIYKHLMKQTSQIVSNVSCLTCLVKKTYGPAGHPFADSLVLFFFFVGMACLEDTNTHKHIDL